jgi:hypothetical protein
MIPRWSLTLLVFGGGVLDFGCAGQAINLDGYTPSLGPLEYMGQAPDSPEVLLLHVEFSDPDGDLGNGVLEIFANDQSTDIGGLPLEPLFFENDLALDAVAGALDFVVEIAIDESSIPEEGAVFKIGARAVDSESHVSNTQERMLEIHKG